MNPRRIEYVSLPFCRLTLTTANPGPYGYPANLQTLGQRIRVRRMDLGLLQKDLARMWGATEQSVRFWGLDKTRPIHKYMLKIIQFLGYDPFPEPKTLGEWQT